MLSRRVVESKAVQSKVNVMYKLATPDPHTTHTRNENTNNCWIG